MKNLKLILIIITIIISLISCRKDKIYGIEDTVSEFVETVEKPFSYRLNNFIKNWYEQHKTFFVFTNLDDFDDSDIEGTFKKHKELFERDGIIMIWKGKSNNTIFGEPEINHYFRAWHDYIHIMNNLGYSFAEESLVGEIQKNELSKNWVYERQLINVEITGQGQYFSLNNKFVKNQRKFTRDYLFNPIDAMKV